MARRKTVAPGARPSVTSSLHLATLRQKKNISLEQIADRTKISIRFLRAIEEEEFEKLPGGIFNTSYLRQYAAATSFDPSELLSYYDRLMNPRQTSENGRASQERGLLERWFRVPAVE